jgi:hypothetical protein
VTQSFAGYQDFLSADPRRRDGRTLEIGIDWRDGERRFRVCYYTATGELTAEQLAADEPLDLEDFERGIAGVEVVAVIPTRAELDRMLGPWPAVERCRPRTAERLRELVGHRRLRVVR